MTASDRPRRTVLRAARLFDGTDVTADPVVVLDGARIVSVGTSDGRPEDADVVDLGDATLLPGLIDTHVHLAFDASPDPVTTLAARDDDAALAAMTAAARATAYGGVTTVRDLGDRDYLSLRVRAAAATDPTLPTVLVAGPPITSPDGHCHFLGGAAVGEDGVRAAVRERVDRGVDVIKVMASGGNMTPGSRPDESQFTVDELRAVVDEAHRHGLPVTAHAHGTRSVVEALAAGVDGIEHATFMTATGVDPVPPDVVAALCAGPTVLGLTVGMMPVPGATPPPEILSRIPALMANVRMLVAAGVPVVLGTDAGIAPLKPPDVLRWAVGDLVTVGASPLDALRACTVRAAQTCRLADRKGRVAPGYDADLLAVDGDPTTDPAALHRIRAVWVRGARLR